MKFIINELDILSLENTVLYFYTPWMPFHKKMIKVLSSLESKYNNLKFYCVDCDSFKSLAKVYEIEEVPTILIYDSNKKEKKS